MYSHRSRGSPVGIFPSLAGKGEKMREAAGDPGD